MRSARIYRYPKAGIASLRWERWILFLLKTLAGLSVVFFDFALLFLVAKDSLILSYLLPSTWDWGIFRDLLSG
jgi:hypothetical protein